MRSLLFTLSLSLVLSACAGGVSGSFRGNGSPPGPAVAPENVNTAQNKESMTGAYTELGLAKGSAPTAQQAVDQAKVHCGRAGGNYLIMNTEPFQSGSSYKVDAVCAKV